MTGLACPHCGSDEIRIEVPGYLSYRPVRIEEVNGRRLLIAEHYDSGESDSAGEFYCLDCGRGEISEADLGLDGWQDTERWEFQQKMARRAAKAAG